VVLDDYLRFTIYHSPFTFLKLFYLFARRRVGRRAGKGKQRL